MLSWQPSQEANFQTASFGLARAISQLPHRAAAARRASQRNTGPSLQMKAGPSWQCPQSPIAHFMLRSIDT